jgi:hypothetical protein
LQRTRADQSKERANRCRKKIAKRLNFMYKRKHGERKIDAFLCKMMDEFYESSEIGSSREMKILLDIMEEENLEPCRFYLKHFIRFCLHDY